MKWLLGCLALGAFLWAAGLVWFVRTMPHSQDWVSQADAVVVLTGGDHRIDTGIDLLSKGLGKRLFISGVHQDVKIDAFIRLKKLPKEWVNLIELGYQSTNTLENAKETAEWVKSRNFSSIRLVTSNYHLRRSYLEFKTYLPHTKIILHPVETNKFTNERWWEKNNLLFITIEYNKYLEAFVRYCITIVFSY
jgi:uncharacterized SAM-binding protein YcdF (DUF218 family)